MSVTFYCRVSGRHIGLDELMDLPLRPMDKWKIHKFYCPYCGDYTSELSENTIEQSVSFKYG